MKLRAVLYARISKADANVPKVANQLTTLRTLAETRGYQVVGEYSDDGISASTGEARPEFQRLSADLSVGAFDVILATEEARLARTELEKAGLMFACANVGATWETLRDGAVDPATASGALMATIRGGVDAFESRRKSERQLKGESDRRAAGKPRKAGPRPFGYNEDRSTLREDEAALVKQGIDMILAGAPRWDVVKLFNASGFPTTVTKLVCPSRSCEEKVANKKVLASDRAKCPDADNHQKVPSYAWRPSTVYDTLIRARNAKLIEHRAKDGNERTPDGKRPLRVAPEIIGEGTWDPICTKEELLRVRAVLATPVRESAGKPPATLLSGVAKCYCGAVLHAHGMSWARVYRCSTLDDQWDRKPAPTREDGTPGKHIAIKIELLDEKVRGAVLDNYFTTPTGTGAAAAEAADVAKLHEQIAKVRGDIETLAYALTNGMPRGVWAKRNAEMVHEEAELTERLAAMARESAHAAMLAESFASIFVRAGDEVDLPESEDNGDGTSRWRAGSSLIRSMEREGMTREEAVNRSVQHYWSEAQDQPAVREKLSERFDALPLSQQRLLIRSLLSITVRPGRGANRVVVDPI